MEEFVSQQTWKELVGLLPALAIHTKFPNKQKRLKERGEK